MNWDVSVNLPRLQVLGRLMECRRLIFIMTIPYRGIWILKGALYLMNCNL